MHDYGATKWYILHGKMSWMHPRYYWFEILQTVIKSFEGWGQVIIFLLLELTLLVFSVSISSVYKSL